MFSFGIARITSPPSPQFGQLVPLFLDVKNDVLARITEPSNDDYDNGVSDNCDQNFGTFDDFGVKNDQKVSPNMILVSKYKGPHVEKKVKKFGLGPPPGNARKKLIFFCEVFPYANHKSTIKILKVVSCSVWEPNEYNVYQI